VYIERHFPLTNDNGLISIEIGGGTVVSGSFASIDWTNGPYFIKTETDLDGGANYTITGTSQLLSVPYALYAKTSENCSELKTNYDQLLNRIEALETYLADSGFYNLKDIDGNIYQSIRIGDQIWMAENLRVTRYNNGDTIKDGSNAGNIEFITEPKYYFNYLNSEDSILVNGRLYTYFVIDDVRQVCPFGWHVPSYEEWQTLINVLEGSSIAGGKLKETGLAHWYDPNTGATNETGFTAMPSGYRSYAGGFAQLGLNTYFWTSTSQDNSYALGQRLAYDSSEIGLHETQKVDGISIRCIKN